MRHFTKSLGKLSWALSLFGLGGLAELVRGLRDGHHSHRPATPTFDAATSEQSFSHPLRAVFKLGDQLVGGMVDLMFGSERSQAAKRECHCSGHGDASAGTWPHAGSHHQGAASGWPGGGFAGFPGWSEGTWNAEDFASHRPHDAGPMPNPTASHQPSSHPTASHQTAPHQATTHQTASHQAGPHQAAPYQAASQPETIRPPEFEAARPETPDRGGRSTEAGPGWNPLDGQG
ncbi:MAG: hypothetical protein AAF560_25510 [Acidobacteriota bacterium]